MNYKKIRRKISKKIFHYQWQLMFSLDEVKAKQYSNYKKIIPPKNKYWADPFIIFKDNRYYVFFEEFIYEKNKGNISFLIINTDGSYSKPTKILDMSYHLSYPFIFHFNEKYYMIPESSANNTIDIYECSKFPEKWIFHKTIMKNITATDTTLFYKNEKWWLFTSITNQNKKRENELFLFHSDNPLSDKWISHPKNPIVSNIKGSRSAGKIFEENGKIIRPAQDGSIRYGYGIIFYQIGILNETEYQEKEIRSIQPNWDKKMIGVHTFGQENKLTMIDIRMKNWMWQKSKSKSELSWLHFIRNEEIKIALKYFPVKQNIKILELGGGDGFVAKKINESGYEIISIDQTPKHPQYFSVSVGNASKIEFESEKFDIVFSSHVVAHIDEKKLFFTECKRVLKKNGLIIHFVPSTTWSVVTNFWHYILLPKFFVKWKKSNKEILNSNNLNDDVNKQEKIKKRIFNMLFLHPLGTKPSFIHEIYFFSKYQWKKLFQDEGFNIIKIENGPYFYSGHNIFKNKFLGLRKILAKNGFAGSLCFVLKK